MALIEYGDMTDGSSGKVSMDYKNCEKSSKSMELSFPFPRLLKLSLYLHNTY